MVRKIVLSSMLVILLLPISARSEIWIGADLVYDLNVPSDEIKENFVTYGGNIESINSGGFGFDLIFFPSDVLRIGPFMTLDIMFPVGVTSAGNTEVLTSYESDFRLDTTFGLSYYQLVGPRFGFFIDCGMEYGFYRISTTNRPNDPTPVEYRRFGEWSLIADAGVIAIRKNSFFRLYAGFSGSLFQPSFGFRVVIGAGGGFIF